MSRARVYIIAGPTAGGKSALALRMADELDGIIINADSMQVYDALPLLTAQPSPSDKTQMPHRLYGVLQPGEACSAARWREMALAEIDAALSAGRTPIVTGGTGFYIESLMRGLSPIPDVPPETRAAAMALQRELGNPGFHAELARRDPVMAARLNPNDTQRLIRAFEVLEATGESLAHWQALPPAGAPEHLEFEVTLVMPPRAELHRRCDMRFDAMLENSALEEVGAFAARIAAGEIAEDAPVANALGFRALRDHLAGKLSLAQAAEQAKADTRQYAKRQETWFRHRLKPDKII